MINKHHPSLSIQSLKLWRGEHLIQTEISFEGYPGDIIGVIGPNGVGKTTLLHSITGLLPSAEGQIKVFGQNLRGLSNKRCAELFSLQFQNLSLGLPVTVKEALEMACFPHEGVKHPQKSKKLIQDFTATFELERFLERDLMSLSGGEQQRVALAMCFIQDTPIMLLDEPLNHLDLKHQSLALRLFNHQAQEKKQCLIISCHNLQIAQQICNKVLLLSHSEQAKFGATEALLTPKHLEPIFEISFRDIRQSSQAIWSPHV